MLRKKSKKKPSRASLASVQKEMAQPRMARSAKIAELKLDTARVPEHASTTLPGTVGKIIPSVSPSKPEKAQIAVDGPDRGYRDLRIDNALISTLSRTRQEKSTTYRRAIFWAMNSTIPRSLFFQAAEQPTELGKQACVFILAAPCNILGGLALRKIPQLGRLFAVIKELVHRNFKGTSKFL
jgi:hypothetical protein